VYTAAQFRTRFRVPLALYRLLKRELPRVEPSLRQRTDATGRLWHPLYAKLLTSLRRLGSGVSVQDLDDQCRMAPETQRQVFTTFLHAARSRFRQRFLNREPTALELRCITDQYSARGFPGCAGAVDCMKLVWKNCPRALKGQFHNPKDSKMAVISCEAVADSSLYCSHWFAGRPGTNNDVNVLDNSPLFTDILSGRRCMHLPDGYVLNGLRRRWRLYFLGDGIYPRWAISFLPISTPTSDKEKHSGRMQESVRKDVERMFGFLQGKFLILRRERHEWSDEPILLTAQVCVILHNMIVVMQREGDLAGEAVGEDGETPVDLVQELSTGPPAGGEHLVVGPAGGPAGVGGLPALLERVSAVKSE